MIGMGLGVLALCISVVVALRGTRGEVPPKRHVPYDHDRGLLPTLVTPEPEPPSVSRCPAGVMAWWSGNTVALQMDSVRDQGLALRNSVAISEGRNDRRAFNFDGNHDFVELKEQHQLRDLPRFTLAAWIKAAREPRFRGIVGKIHSQEPRSGYLLSLNAGGRLRCDAVDNHATSRFGAAVSDLRVDDNEWHHVACTYDGNQVKVFVDGVQRGSTSYSGVVGVTHEPLVIGKDPFIYENRHFKGLIDEIAIFSRPLPAQELTTLMSLLAEECAR